MINQEVVESLKGIVSSCLRENNLELVEMSYHGRHNPVLSIFIDRPQGGVTIDECARMNGIIIQLIDSSGILSSGYILEVSSPGIDRPLRKKNDFQRAINREVRCFLKEPVEAKIEIEGVIKVVKDESVILNTVKGEIELPYKIISKARQIVN